MLSSLLKHTAYLALARFFSALARVIYAVLLAKILGPETYGTFQYGYSWYLLFVPLSILGMNFVIIRNLNKEDVDQHHFLTLTYSIRTWLSIFVAAVCLISNYLLEQNTLLNLLVAIFALTITGRGLAGWVTAAFTGLQRPQAVFKLETVFRTLEVIVGIALLLLGFGILWLALWHALSWFLQGWFGLRLLRKNSDFGALRKINLAEFSITVKDCLPVFVAALCLMWFLQGPIVLSRYIFGLGEQLGHFALVMQAFIILSSLVAEFGNAALPLLTRQFEKSEASAQGYVGGVILVGLGLSIVTTIPTHFLGEMLIVLLLGAEYADVAALLPYSMLLIGPYFWLISFRSLFVSQNKYTHLIVSNIIGVIAFTLIAVTLSKTLGEKGILLGLGAGLVLSSFWQFLYLHKTRLKK